MKKLLLGIALLSLPIFSLAQNSQNLQGGNKESNLGDLTLRFCNDKSIIGGSKGLQMTAKPGEEKEVCILLNNNGPTPLKIGLNFVDGSSTSDIDAKKACQPEDTKTYFGQYISAEDTGFLVKPGQTIQTIVKAKFPEGYAGMAYGCTTFQVIDDNKVESTGMFQIVSRRANFVDIYVDGKIDVGIKLTGESNKSINNISNNDNIVIYDNIVKKGIVSKINIYNTGNVGVTGDIDISYKYMWIFEGKLEGQKFRVMPKLTMPYEFDTPSLEISIPGIVKIRINYIKYIGGPLDIKYNINYKPEIFGPDTQSIVKNYNIKAEASTFIVPRWLIILLIIIALYITYKNRKNRSNKKIKDEKIIL